MGLESKKHKQPSEASILTRRDHLLELSLLERAHLIQETMDANDFNRQEAAKYFGISSSYLFKLLLPNKLIPPFQKFLTDAVPKTGQLSANSVEFLAQLSDEAQVALLEPFVTHPPKDQLQVLHDALEKYKEQCAQDEGGSAQTHRRTQYRKRNQNALSAHDPAFEKQGPARKKVAVVDEATLPPTGEIVKNVRFLLRKSETDPGFFDTRDIDRAYYDALWRAGLLHFQMTNRSKPPHLPDVKSEIEKEE